MEKYMNIILKIIASIYLEKHLDLLAYFANIYTLFDRNTDFLITLIKCPKGHKSLRRLSDAPETPTECDGGKNQQTNNNLV